MTAVPTMKTVASDVPPTGTFSMGTGKASTKADAKRSTARPASMDGDGSSAARAEIATTTATVPAKTTGTTTGSRRLVSRETRTAPCPPAEASAVDGSAMVWLTAIPDSPPDTGFWHPRSDGPQSSFFD